MRVHPSSDNDGVWTVASLPSSREPHKDVRFVPYLGESAVPRALLRSIVLKNGWQLVDSDGSDASE